MAKDFDIIAHWMGLIQYTQKFAYGIFRVCLFILESDGATRA